MVLGVIDRVSRVHKVLSFFFPGILGFIGLGCNVVS